MNRPHMDHNKMAALLEGRLPQPERDQAVAHLSAVDEDAEVFADAAAVLAELEAEDGVAAEASEDAEDPDTGRDASVVPLRPPSTERTRRRVPVRWLALAAVLAGMVLIPLAISRSRGPAGPGEYVAALTRPDAGVAEAWGHTWPQTRGPGEVGADEALSARLGALNVDLELAMAARQAEPTARIARRIGSMLTWPGSGPAAFVYAEIASDSAASPDVLMRRLDTGRNAVGAYVNEESFSLGAWAEAARIAAASRDAAFFRSRASRRAADRAAALDSMDEPTRGAIETIRAAGEGEGEPDWPRVAKAADDVLGHLAR